MTWAHLCAQHPFPFIAQLSPGGVNGSFGSIGGLKRSAAGLFHKRVPDTEKFILPFACARDGAVAQKSIMLTPRKSDDDDDGARVKPEVGAVKPREVQELERQADREATRNNVQMTFFVFLTEVVRDDLIPLETSERTSLIPSQYLHHGNFSSRKCG